jgi:hypothetical protein
MPTLIGLSFPAILARADLRERQDPGPMIRNELHISVRCSELVFSSQRKLCVILNKSCE